MQAPKVISARKSSGKYIPSAIRELAKLEPIEQANRAREMAVALRKDERWTNGNHPEHKQAFHEMYLLYQGQYFEDNGGRFSTRNMN